MKEDNEKLQKKCQTHGTQMTKNDMDKWQDQKKDRIKWQKNDNANGKINIFMYPSVWLQVPSNASSFSAFPTMIPYRLIKK